MAFNDNDKITTDELCVDLKNAINKIVSGDLERKINNHINTYVNNIKQKNDIIIELKDVCYKYTKNANDIVRDLNLKIYNITTRYGYLMKNK